MTNLHGRIIAKRLLSALLTLASPSLAHAWNYDIYRADYSRNVFCAAIAGACSADTNRENSLFQNPGALVSKSGFLFDGDYFFDHAAEPGARPGNEFVEQIFMAGIGWSGPKTGEKAKWGIGFTVFGYHQNTLSDAGFITPDSRESIVRARTESLTFFYNLPVAIRLSERLTLGASILAVSYKENLSAAGGSPGATVIESSGEGFPPLSFTIGTQYEHSEHLRFGAWFRAPKRFDFKRDVTVNTPDRGLVSFKETANLNFPWQLSGGVSWSPFQDELTLLLDLVLVGTTDNGYLRPGDSFIADDAQSARPRPKGRDLALEPRLGLRTPLGRGSPAYIHGGTYFEAGRWEGIPGRVHTVMAMSYKLKMHLEPLVGVDLAREYFQLFVTVR